MQLLKRGQAVLAGALISALTLVGCAGGVEAESPKPTQSAAEFQVSVEHAYGTLELDAVPQRIVALGWMESDVLVALGHEPIAMQQFAFAADGVSPWLQEELVGEPQLLDTARGGGDAAELDLEAVAALKPDLIVAVTYTDLAKFYDELVKIAPVLGPAEKNYLELPWQDQTVAVASALGEKAAGEQLVADTEGALTAAAAAHPELKGKDYTLSLGTPDQLKVLNNPEDGSVEVMQAFGLEYSKTAADLPDLGDGSGSAGVAEENVLAADADIVFIGYFGEGTQQQWESSPIFNKLEAARGSGYLPLDLTDLTALRNPSPLALPYVVENIMLAKVVPALS